MPNVCFFTFKEDNRDVVATIKGRAVNPHYYGLNFRVQDLVERWNTTDRSRIRAAISTTMTGTSRTIVFVGSKHSPELLGSRGSKDDIGGAKARLRYPPQWN